MPIIVGLDHGNGWIKAMAERSVFVLPSYMVRGGDLGESIYGKSLDVREYVSAQDRENTYLWGEDVTKADKVLSSYGSQNRYNSKEFQLLSQFALSTLLTGSDTFDDVIVITGVPSQQKGTSVEDDIKRAIKGTHVVTVDGKEKVIRVTEVIVIPQPIGTVFNSYLDEEGFVDDDNYEDITAAIIDVGTGTTDLDIVKELRRQEDESHSITIGMFDIYERIAQAINKENPSANATFHKVEQQFNKDSYVISKRAAVDIREYKEKYVTQVAEDIANEITRKWKTWDRFDEIIVTGGGAEIIGPKLRKLIPDVNIIAHGQTANADGFYKYGVYARGE